MDSELKMPASLDAEKSVLSMAIQHKSALGDVLERLTPDDFFAKSSRLVMESLRTLADRNEDINRLSIQQELERRGIDVRAVGGISFLVELESYEAGVAGLDYFIRLVREKSLQRRMVEVAEKIAREGLSGAIETEDYLNRAEQMVFGVTHTDLRAPYLQIGVIVDRLMGEMEAMRTNAKENPAVKTGFLDLDSRLGGMHPSDLVILAARPAMGKTTLALNIATNVAMRQGKHVVVFSLEMSAAQLAVRLISSLSFGLSGKGRGISGTVFRDGRISNADLETLSVVLPKVKPLPITVDDSPAISILDLRARARKLRADGRCDFIVIDYMQLMKGSGSASSREQEVGEISRSLKALAKELGIPILALSQLNRMLENRSDKRPLMSDLRESGSIEQDADMILFIYRDEVYNKEKSEKAGMADVIIGKHRHGATGEVTLAFNAKYTQFADLATNFSQV